MLVELFRCDRKRSHSDEIDARFNALSGRHQGTTSISDDRARCDARVVGDLTAPRPERAASSVTPRMREQVVMAFGGACAVPGCRSSRCLEIHHVIPQAEGGPHEMWNLVPLCDGHHVADHLGLLRISGRAPFDLAFEWRSPPRRAPVPQELAMICDDDEEEDVPAGTPWLDPAREPIVRCSTERSAHARRRVRSDSDAGELPATRHTSHTERAAMGDDVPAGTRRGSG